MNTAEDPPVADRDVLVVVGRPTFDLDSAGPIVARAIDQLGPTVVLAGAGRILQSPGAVAEAMADLPPRARTLVILFASFADSRLAAAAVDHFERVDHVVLWSLPERWDGGRLLRNSLCGANLAAYRLVGEGRHVGSVHQLPDASTPASIEAAIATTRDMRGRGSVVPVSPVEGDDAEVVCAVVAAVRDSSIGVIGDPPEGFEPCGVDIGLLPAGVTLTATGIDGLFAESERSLVEPDRDAVDRLMELPGGESIERGGLARTVALRRGAERLAHEHDWNAVAIRCWPECFGRWGGAACAAMGLMNDAGVPAACEADALGALSMRMMQRAAGGPTFLADLVDADFGRDQVVFWHCGVAPPSTADPSHGVRVGLHPNRHVPLVFDFGLANGPVTIARLSQSGGELRLVVGEGDIVGGQPFEGTSCVVQLPTSAQALVSTVLTEGIEHHFVVAAGHHRGLLEAVAAELSLPVVGLT